MVERGLHAAPRGSHVELKAPAFVNPGLTLVGGFCGQRKAALSRSHGRRYFHSVIGLAAKCGRSSARGGANPAHGGPDHPPA